MAQEPTDRSDTGSRLVLDIWHPGCWTLEVTDGASGGLLGHGVYTDAGTAIGRFTAYADSTADLDALLRAIRSSPLTDSIREMEHRYDGTVTPAPGTATRGLLVEYDASRTINDALVSRGFIPDKPVRMANGREYWTVVTGDTHDAIGSRLDDVRREMDAEIRIQRITDDEAERGVFPTDALTERQREVFELAREREYYAWPRGVSASDLADELDLSKATLLEHPRRPKRSCSTPCSEDARRGPSRYPTDRGRRSALEAAESRSWKDRMLWLPDVTRASVSRAAKRDERSLSRDIGALGAMSTVVAGTLGAGLFVTQAYKGSLAVYVPWVALGCLVFAGYWYRGRRAGTDVEAILETLPGVPSAEYDPDVGEVRADD